jgi:hypothetical protein
MAVNNWYCRCGLKDNAAVRAIRRVHASVRSREFQGCFVANTALSLVQISRVRVGLINLLKPSVTQKKTLSLINLQSIHG